MGKGNQSGTGSGVKSMKQAAKPSHKAKAQSKSDNAAGSLVLPSKLITHTAIPQGWPSTMAYLALASPSRTLTPAQQAILQPSALPPSNPEPYHINSLATFSPTANPLIHIKPITDPNHPAYPQCGLFAAKPLPPGTHIVDYTGLIHSCPQPECATSDYDLAFLDRDASLAIDGSTMGNEGRFVNDYHGVRADGPNALFEEYYVKVKGTSTGGGGSKDLWQARMGIWVQPLTKSRLSKGQAGPGQGGIAKGEEICVSYGKGWWRARRGLMEESTLDGEPAVDSTDEVLVEELSNVSIVDEN